MAVLPCSASRGLSKSNLHQRELFFPAYKYRYTYNKLQLLDELLMLKMLWHCVQKSSLQAINRVVIFSAATKWRWSPSSLEYYGCSEVFRSLNRSKLSKYLGYMHSIYQNGIGTGRHYQELGDEAEFLCLRIPERLSDGHCSRKFSLRGWPIPAISTHPGASWRRLMPNTLETFCRMELDGDDLEDVAHRRYKCCLCTVVENQQWAGCDGGWGLLLAELLMAKPFHRQL